jgi:CheY-like chemotaxis protein
MSDDKSKSRTILVVEDVEEISLLMRTMLRKRGHHVLNAANARRALEIAEKERPKLILTDLDLPMLDQLIRLVRAHRDLKNLPVAIIDIDGPKVDEKSGLKVLVDFDQLDELLQSPS